MLLYRRELRSQRTQHTTVQLDPTPKMVWRT